MGFGYEAKQQFLSRQLMKTDWIGLNDLPRTQKNLRGENHNHQFPLCIQWVIIVISPTPPPRSIHSNKQPTIVSVPSGGWVVRRFEQVGL